MQAHAHPQFRHHQPTQVCCHQTVPARCRLLDRIELRQYATDTPEIQADTVEAVALQSAEWVAKRLKQPVVVADAGLAIHTLNGELRH